MNENRNPQDPPPFTASDALFGTESVDPRVAPDASHTLVATRARPARTFAVVAAVVGLLAGWSIVAPQIAHADEPDPASALVVSTDAGALQGIAGDGVNEFRGVPYAAPPTGDLRWRAPQAVTPWTDVREASVFSPVCPQDVPSPNGSSEDCLYLNVTAPAGAAASAGKLPVIVFIHGGGFSLGEGADYDATKLAKSGGGAVVVTINYRLGLLGFLAHPAFAEKPGGPAGNYGLMDQQAALKWVQRNIANFGGDPRNVTIDGQSAGGLSVLAQMVSPGAKGLFHRAIVESGAFAPKQRSLADAATEGQAIAAAAGCPDQSAACLRALPVETLLANAPKSFTPGVIDGAVIKESVLGAIAAGDFNRVPLINGTNTEEERLFALIHLSVTRGATIDLPPIDATNYESVLASNFGVSAQSAKRIAKEYPIAKYPRPELAFTAANSDANFSCPALLLDAAASLWVPTYGYDFNDDTAPERFIAPDWGLVATHQTELQYLFDLPNAYIAGELSADQEQLASAMREAWVTFAKTGSPATATQPWAKFDVLRHRTISLKSPTSAIETGFSSKHHCGFWAGIAITNLR
ncbi:carboxylesterase family protein [Agromyces protaetiae]|uniref:Carboxylic ester hydrolase n=1 Tax=Agromyces protaetiae TaxID=2509455 RepID=A0A4P6FBG8_9MICO|nr:carboxylesterase family protein [Agromyces protaetiae]QAY73600.1 carboxylesterase family protein [Agromyces protaetiae]